MNEDFYIKLIYQKLDNEISDQDDLLLTEWLEKSESNRMTFESISRVWKNTNRVDFGEVDLDKDFAQLEEKVFKKEEKNKVIPLRIWLSAASILLLVLVSYQQLYNSNKLVSILAEVENLEHTLPDKSTVFLEEGTTIEYNSKFKRNRTISLDGSAFFEVQHDPENPFSVNSSKSIVTVLGTSFYILEAEDSGEVIVESGKVKVKSLLQPDSLILTKDQSAIVKSDTIIPNSKIDRNKLSWQTGILTFDNVELVDCIRYLESHFNVQIALNLDIERCPITAKFDAENQDLTLETISKLFNSELVKTGERSFSINGGACG